MSPVHESDGARMVRTHIWLTTALVSGYLVALRWAVPEPSERATAHYVLVITLGYGHLIGALAGAIARRRRLGLTRSDGARGVTSWLFAVCLLFSLYELGLAAMPVLVLPLLAISSWHTIENEWALRCTYGQGLAVPSLSSDPRVRFATAGLTLAVLILAAGTLSHHDFGSLLPLVLAETLPDRPFAPLAFGDVFAATTLYHLVGWLVYLGQRAKLDAGRSRRRTLRLLAWTHLPPALVCAQLLALPRHAASPVYEIFFSPSIYLFWSALHVVQTLVSRRSRT